MLALIGKFVPPEYGIKANVRCHFVHRNGNLKQ